MDGGAARMLMLYAALAVLVVLLPTARVRSLGAMGLVLAGVGVTAERTGAAGSGGFRTINLSLAAAGTLLVLFAIALAIRDAAAGRTRPAPQPPGIDRRPLDGILLLGLLLASAGPHLLVLGVGILLAIVAAARAALSGGRRLWLLPLAFGGLLLGAALFLLATILGPTGGWVNQVAGGPISPPAERLLVMLLAAGGLLVAGLPPLHRAPWRLSLSPLPAILLARLLVPAFPAGLAEWQALGMLLTAAMLAAAALAGRWAAVSVAAGILCLWSGESAAVLPGSVLVLTGWMADLRLPAPAAAEGPARWTGVLLLASALAAPFALGAAFRAQVLIPVLACAFAAAGFGLDVRRRSRAF